MTNDKGGEIPLIFMKLDSREEQQLLSWFKELEELEIILNITRGPVFDLFEGLTEIYEKITELKTKTKTEIKEKRILHPHIYTSDFLVNWNLSSPHFYLFKNIHNNNPETIVECKGTFNVHNSIRMFSINQKWVYSKYKVLVKLLIPAHLFASTFYPKEVLKAKRKFSGEECNIHKFLENV